MAEPLILATINVSIPFLLAYLVSVHLPRLTWLDLTNLEREQRKKGTTTLTIKDTVATASGTDEGYEIIYGVRGETSSSSSSYPAGISQSILTTNVLSQLADTLLAPFRRRSLFATRRDAPSGSATGEGHDSPSPSTAVPAPASDAGSVVFVTPPPVHEHESEPVDHDSDFQLTPPAHDDHTVSKDGSDRSVELHAPGVSSSPNPGFQTDLWDETTDSAAQPATTAADDDVPVIPDDAEEDLKTAHQHRKDQSRFSFVPLVTEDTYHDVDASRFSSSASDAGSPEHHHSSGYFLPSDHVEGKHVHESAPGPSDPFEGDLEGADDEEDVREEQELESQEPVTSAQAATITEPTDVAPESSEDVSSVQHGAAIEKEDKSTDVAQDEDLSTSTGPVSVLADPFMCSYPPAAPIAPPEIEDPVQFESAAAEDNKTEEATREEVNGDEKSVAPGELAHSKVNPAVRSDTVASSTEDVFGSVHNEKDSSASKNAPATLGDSTHPLPTLLPPRSIVTTSTTRRSSSASADASTPGTELSTGSASTPGSTMLATPDTSPTQTHYDQGTVRSTKSSSSGEGSHGYFSKFHFPGHHHHHHHHGREDSSDGASGPLDYAFSHNPRSRTSSQGSTGGSPKGTKRPGLIRKVVTTVKDHYRERRTVSGSHSHSYAVDGSVTVEHGAHPHQHHDELHGDKAAKEGSPSPSHSPKRSTLTKKVFDDEQYGMMPTGGRYL